MKRKFLRLASLAAALALTLCLVGCGGGGKDAGGTAAASSYASQKNTLSSMDSAADEMYGGGIGAAPAAPEESFSSQSRENTTGSLLPQDGRKVILNANLTIEALDFDAACSALLTALKEAGGYVSSADMNTPSYEGARRSAHYQMRVPAAKYDQFLEGAGKAGNLVNKNESGQDVTAEYVDVEARLKSLRLQEERLYEMMEQAGELETLLAIQNQLTEVQYQIESYTARQRTYDDLIAYSTVDIDVEEVRQITEKAETYADRIAKAFRTSWSRFGDDVQDFTVWFIEAIPSLLVLALVVLIVFLLARAARRRAEAYRAAHPAAPYQPAKYAAPPKAPKDGQETQTKQEPKYK